jgi:hypothetical protein
VSSNPLSSSGESATNRALQGGRCWFGRGVLDRSAAVSGGAIALFGFKSGAALATVVGVLVEVPVMLSVVRIVLRTRGWYEHRNCAFTA